MGFGILFIGNLLLFFCKGVDIFPDSAAYLMILIALRKLAVYNRGFLRAKQIAYPLLAASVVGDVFQILAAMDIIALGMSQRILMALVSCGMLAMYWFTLDGIKCISKDVGRIGIAEKAGRNKLLTVFYVFTTLIYQIKFDFLNDMVKYFGIIFIITGIVWVYFNATLFYSCYMWICLEGDENMPEKPKKFKERKK